MPLFHKTILKVGKYESPDGTVNVTPERLKRWANNHRKLKSNNYFVPIDFDHADDAVKAQPLSSTSWPKRRSAANTVGHLRDFKLSKDGQSAEILLDVHRKQASRLAKDNSVFVSPVIFDNWKDGRGNKYEDVITHIDFVNHPVDNSQSPFKPVEKGTIACALRLGIKSEEKGKPILWRLSKDDDEEYDDDTETGDTTDDLTDASVDDDGYDDDDVTSMSDEEDDSYSDDGYNDSSSESDIASQISEDLEAVGIAPPEGVDPVKDSLEFLQQLCAALRQKKMDDDGGDEMDFEEEEDDFNDSDFDEAAGTTGGVTVTQPEFAAMGLRTDALYKAHEKNMKESLKKRLSLLVKSGRCTSDEYKKQVKGVDVVRLSLNNEGEERKTNLHRWIESREAVPEGTFWPGDKSVLRMAGVVEPDISLDGAPTKEQAKKYVDSQAERNPGYFRQ